jgi:hypothetical protein
LAGEDDDSHPVLPAVSARTPTHLFIIPERIFTARKKSHTLAGSAFDLCQRAAFNV